MISRGKVALLLSAVEIAVLHSRRVGRRIKKEEVKTPYDLLIQRFKMMSFA